MKPALRLRTVWLVLNAVGIAAYLAFASKLWVVSGEEGMPGGPGDAFYWLLFLAPVLGLFLIFNTVALVAIVRRRSATQLRLALFVWLVVVGLWAGTLAVDHYRSVRFIDAAYV